MSCEKKKNEPLLPAPSPALKIVSLLYRGCSDCLKSYSDMRAASYTLENRSYSCIVTTTSRIISSSSGLTVLFRSFLVERCKSLNKSTSDSSV